MKIAVIGVGGVGGYFGGKLANAQLDVTFLARGKHLEAIKANGLKVKSILGSFKVPGVLATDDIREIGKSDLIILGVKAWQLAELRDQLHYLFHSETVILPLQNGVSAFEELNKSIDTSHLLGGVCKIVSKIESPGIINHLSVTPSIEFGEFNGTISDRIDKIKSVFDTAGIESRISKDIVSQLWKKFGFICIAGLMAVRKTSLGELRDAPESREMMVSLLREINDLAIKMDINLGSDFLDKTLQFIDSLDPGVTFSLARDIWEKRPSEIEHQNGAVVRLGEKYGIETPVNRFIYDHILPMELQARKQFK